MQTGKANKNTIKLFLLGFNFILFSCSSPTTGSQSASPTPVQSPTPSTVPLATKPFPDTEQATPAPVIARENKGVVTTFAGGDSGSADGTGRAASFHGPSGIVFDKKGSMYIADANNNLIRKISSDGIVSTVAGGEPGNKDGNGKNASFYNPVGIGIDNSGNIFVADSNNHCVKKITPSGDVSTFAGGEPGFSDGKGKQAQFYYPSGIAVDSSGNVFVGDTSNNRVRKITPDGTVSTLAGNGEPGNKDGNGNLAELYKPLGVAVDSKGAVYFADSYNNRIRKIDAGGNVTTIAGNESGNFDGQGSNALFFKPSGIAVDNQGNIYVTDIGNQSIKKISSGGNVKIFAGNPTAGSSDGTGTEAKFTFFNAKAFETNMPGIAVDSNNNVFVADYYNNTIRKIE